MKKIRIIGRDQPTTDYGVLSSGKEYTISDPLAAFLLRRGFAEAVASKKAVKKADKK
jgi:hypothetical protein